MSGTASWRGDLLVKGLLLLGWPILMFELGQLGKSLFSVAEYQFAGLLIGVLLATVVIHLVVGLLKGSV